MSEPHPDTDTETLQVTVNRETHEAPATIETAAELLEFASLDPDRHDLYRIDGAEEVGPLNGLLVFDEGDEFVTVPAYTTGG